MSQPEQPRISADAGETSIFPPPGGGDGPHDLTGTTLGDFRVERRLGQGGMGEVYLALQVSLNRPVALKVLRPKLLANPSYASRFEAEAWAAAKLNHPNIVHIYSLGSIGAIRFIAMEYVQGTNLREYIARKGPPELPLALSIMRQAGQAVGAAGEVGLVHRDIKPENLLLTKKGQVKVADFGLCRDKEGDLHLTQPGVTMGTPMYMSPEQVQGHALDHRSDLYSLGVTFYHMLAGVPPFRADSAVALALKHVREAPVSLAVHRPDLPADLVRLVMKLMAKSPEGRYASAAEMLRDLAKVKEALQAASAAVPVSLPEAPAVAGASGVGLGGRGSGPASVSLRSGPESAEVRAPWGQRLRGVRVGGRTTAVAVAAAAVVGGLGGWLARADNLLAERDAPRAAAPGLWMAPWDQVAKRRNAAGQYRYAQVEVPEADLVAAWLAVPGHFAHDLHWTDRAYTQLIRTLFRGHDAGRLEALAAELERSRRFEQKGLARVARGAAAALRGDVDGVLNALAKDGKADLTMDVGMAGLCVEVLLFARKTPDAALHGLPLSRLTAAYLGVLRIDLLDPARLLKANPDPPTRR